RLSLERADQPSKSADRIDRTLWIGDVALPSGDEQRAIDRTTPADLDGVAEGCHVAWLGENAMVEFLAALGRPFQQLDRAVHRHALFVAGDQEGNRSFRLAAGLRQMPERGRDRARDAALHVDGAAAVKNAVG